MKKSLSKKQEIKEKKTSSFGNLKIRKKNQKIEEKKQLVQT